MRFSQSLALGFLPWSFRLSVRWQGLCSGDVCIASVSDKQLCRSHKRICERQMSADDDKLTFGECLLLLSIVGVASLEVLVISAFVIYSVAKVVFW